MTYDRLFFCHLFSLCFETWSADEENNDQGVNVFYNEKDLFQFTKRGLSPFLPTGYERRDWCSFLAFVASRPGKKKKKADQERRRKKADQDRGRKKPTRIVKKPTRIGPFLGGALASFGDERYEWKDE